jgi:NADH-quinone oxidoreductase subunit G
MSDQQISIEVDGKKLDATAGQMLIEVTDKAGITVPRFCYHKHLSVAANCRMCLVEVENAPKPLPACATPCTDGMKVFTRSPVARAAQKGTMEFLLINHPLDCPICDQGGECELQDVAMGYGGDVSRFSEQKRVVRDENLGSLIATDMTRCIHCTRCVRFGAEIAGLREMGATGRGEHMRIGVYIEQAVGSELSGNIIDLCPVGALTSKPYRYTARSWELTQADGIPAHDGVGSNVHWHIRRNQIMRAIPRENQACNQTWLSDRDRFAYQGFNADDRIAVPMIRENGKLQETDWDEALEVAANLLKAAPPEKLGALVSPNATTEEAYLAAKLMRGLNSENIDHRLRQVDFRGDANNPSLQWFGQRFEALADNSATLLVGSWLRKEQPMLNHRLRQSFLDGGIVMAINPVAYSFNYDLDVDVVCSPADMVVELAGVAKALGLSTCGVEVDVDESHQTIANTLKEAEQGSIILGNSAMMHPDYSILRRLAASIATAASVVWGTTGFGANDVGATFAGAVQKSGLNASQMLSGGTDTLMVVGAELELDAANAAQAREALADQKVIAVVSHMSDVLASTADVILPCGVIAETSGTLVNNQGDVQSFTGVVPPPGESRPAWKILRVLGNLVDVEGFDYLDSHDVRNELLGDHIQLPVCNAMTEGVDQSRSLVSGIQRIGDVPMYSIDSVVRRSTALQHTPDSFKGQARISSDLAEQIQLGVSGRIRVTQETATVEIEAIADDSVASQCVWLPIGVVETTALGNGFAAISVEKA